jgi:hypothetical protein
LNPIPSRSKNLGGCSAREGRRSRTHLAGLIYGRSASSPARVPWSAGLASRDPSGKLKPSKEKSIERIDGIVATIMAIGRAMIAQEEPQPEYSLHFV